MSKKDETWDSAKGAVEQLHRIREKSYRERQRIGTAAWLGRINRASSRLGMKKSQTKSIFLA